MINSDLLKKQFLASLQEMYVPFVETDMEHNISWDFLTSQFNMYVEFVPTLLKETLVLDFLSTAITYGYKITFDKILYKPFN